MLCKIHVIWDFKNLVIRVVNFRIRFLKKKTTAVHILLCESYFVGLIYKQIFIKKNTHTKRKLLIQGRCSPKELFFDSVFSWVWEGNFPSWLQAWRGAKVNTHVNTK